MKLHYVLIEECYCLHRKMPPRTRAQRRRTTFHDTSNEASVRPQQHAPRGRGRGARKGPQGHGQLGKNEEARNIEGGARAPSITELQVEV